MIGLLTLKNKSFGIDFCDFSVKIASLKRKGSFLKLASWGETILEPGIIEEGEIKDEDKLSNAIREGIARVKGERLKDKKVVVSLPEEKSFFEIIKMPKMEKKELASAISFEAENYIPLPIKDAYLDFQIVPQPNGYSSDSLCVLLGAAPKTLVDSYVSCVKKAGLIPYAMEIESQAVSRALIKNNISPYPVLIIDFGKNRTNFIIFSGYSLEFTSSIPVSYNMLSEAIAKSFKMDFSEAEDLLSAYGLSFLVKLDKPRSKTGLLQKKIFNSTIPILTDFTEQIKKYLSYYETHMKDAGCKNNNRSMIRIFLCGYGANIKCLGDFLSSEVKIPVEFGNPWVNISPDPLKEMPNMPFKESLGYTTALGLALRGIKEDND